MRVIKNDVGARYREKEFAILTLGLGEKFEEKHQNWKKIIDAPPEWQKLDSHPPFAVFKHRATSVLSEIH